MGAELKKYLTKKTLPCPKSFDTTERHKELHFCRLLIFPTNVRLGWLFTSEKSFKVQTPRGASTTGKRQQLFQLYLFSLLS